MFQIVNVKSCGTRSVPIYFTFEEVVGKSWKKLKCDYYNNRFTIWWHLCGNLYGSTTWWTVEIVALHLVKYFIFADTVMEIEMLCLLLWIKYTFLKYEQENKANSC